MCHCVSALKFIFLIDLHITIIMGFNIKCSEMARVWLDKYAQPCYIFISNVLLIEKRDISVFCIHFFNGPNLAEGIHSLPPEF